MEVKSLVDSINALAKVIAARGSKSHSFSHGEIVILTPDLDYGTMWEKFTESEDDKMLKELKLKKPEIKCLEDARMYQIVRVLNCAADKFRSRILAQDSGEWWLVSFELSAARYYYYLSPKEECDQHCICKKYKCIDSNHLVFEIPLLS